VLADIAGDPKAPKAGCVTAPVAVSATAEEYLAERLALLERCLGEVAAKAAPTGWKTCESKGIKGDELKITPLKAVTPEEAEALADGLYGMMPDLRITSLIAEADHWTGFSGAFTHLRSGSPADDWRVVLTAVLADATNLGLTRTSAIGSSPGLQPGICGSVSRSLSCSAPPITPWRARAVEGADWRKADAIEYAWPGAHR
jgi:hypothetical protein